MKQTTPMTRSAWLRKAKTAPTKKPPVQAVSQDRKAQAATKSLAKFPKSAPQRNRRLLDLAKGQPCLLRVPGVCRGGTETTVAAHSNWSVHGKAGARKADDQYSAWGCVLCHGWLDQGPALRAHKQSIFMAAHHRQVMEWRFIAADLELALLDRQAARWALDLLGATPSLFFGADQ